MNKRIGIIIAVEAEAHAILASNKFEFEKHMSIWKSKQYPVDIILSGVGKVLASWALMTLEASGSYSWYCSLGTSGSLGTEAIGSLYFCTEFAEWDMDIRPLGFKRGITAYENQNNPLYATMHDTLANKIQTISGVKKKALVLSGDSFIADNSLSNELKKDFAHDLPILVDMESAALAKICSLRLHKPYCAFRWITDNANKDASNNWQENVQRASEDFKTLPEHIVHATGKGLIDL